MTIDPVIAMILRAGVGLLFLAGCWHKLWAFPAFETTLLNYGLLPPGAVRPAAGTIVAAEACAGLGVFVPAAATGCARLALLLLAAYTVAIAVNLARGRRDIDCGCMGPALRQSLNEWLLLRNAVLMGAAAALLLPRTARPLVPLDWATLGFGIAVSALLYIGANHLISNWPRLQQIRR
jgi:uncharacterized membrane protein YphA (DoxX/SURF4 family)